jgi:hypothetical protein
LWMSNGLTHHTLGNAQNNYEWNKSRVSTCHSNRNFLESMASYVYFLDIDATHNIWYFSIGFFVESWRERQFLLRERS